MKAGKQWVCSGRVGSIEKQLGKQGWKSRRHHAWLPGLGDHGERPMVQWRRSDAMEVTLWGGKVASVDRMETGWRMEG